MKLLLSVFLFIGVIGASIKKSGLINDSVAEAKKLYQQQKYELAIDKYALLQDSLDVTDSELKLNLAHALFQNNDNARSRKYYQELTKDPSLLIQSVALTQLAVLDFEKNNPEKALYHLRRAIIQDPLNEEARYNYELIKKYLIENPPASPAKKNKEPNPKNKPDATQTSPAKPSENGNEGKVTDNSNVGADPATQKQEDTGNKGGNSGENPDRNKPTAGGEDKGNKGRNGSDKKGLSNEEGNGNGNNISKKPGSEAAEQNARQIQTLRARLRKTDLPPEKAMQLLEAMRSAELQYLQQIPRKPVSKNLGNTPDY